MTHHETVALMRRFLELEDARNLVAKQRGVIALEGTDVDPVTLSVHGLQKAMLKQIAKAGVNPDVYLLLFYDDEEDKGGQLTRVYIDNYEEHNARYERIKAKMGEYVEGTVHRLEDGTCYTRIEGYATKLTP